MCHGFFSFLCHLGELEESMTELEESRRKLVNLKMQKDGAADVHISVLSAVNGVSSPDKSADRTMGFRELKESVEEAKVYLQLSFLCPNAMHFHTEFFLLLVDYLCSPTNCIDAGSHPSF